MLGYEEIERRAAERGLSVYQYQRMAAQRAMRLTMELNLRYHEPEEVARLFGADREASGGKDSAYSRPFIPTMDRTSPSGTHVFLNTGCHFKDQGGITIGDGTLIGHNVVLATLNHGVDPERRQNTIPAPIVIEKMSGLAQMPLLHQA